MTIANVGFYSGAADTSDDTITLSGTSGTPNLHSLEDTGVNPSGGWIFDNEGRVYKADSMWAKTTQFQDGTEWNGSQDVPTDDYWIRFTEQSFVDGGGTREYQNASLGSWLKVSGASSTDRAFGVEDLSGDGATEFTVKVEIASDSGGSNIVATGYYKMTAERLD